MCPHLSKPPTLDAAPYTGLLYGQQTHRQAGRSSFSEGVFSLTLSFSLSLPLSSSSFSSSHCPHYVFKGHWTNIRLPPPNWWYTSIYILWLSSATRTISARAGQSYRPKIPHLDPFIRLSHSLAPTLKCHITDRFE